MPEEPFYITIIKIILASIVSDVSYKLIQIIINF